jgi:hypothetical protein
MEDGMVARTIPAPQPITLTRDNHPENALKPETPAANTLGPTIAICSASGLVGMTFGVASLASMRLDDGPWGMTGILPLVALGVVILTGWLGAFYWMCRQESTE